MGPMQTGREPSQRECGAFADHNRRRLGVAGDQAGHDRSISYTARLTWIDSAVEFDCSYGTRLRADMDDLFQIHHPMMAPSEIILHPLRQ
jgi:hypothetical protein